MDESLSQALIMVAGVLIAMLIIGFITISFNQMSSWQSTQDAEVVVEQIQKFNKEWEVYEKDLMYGVDVISCLNKAVNNNEKITNEKVVNGEKYDKDYEVRVHVELKDPKKLEESITVYYVEASSGQDRPYSDGGGPGIALNSITPTFKFIQKDYKEVSNFKGSTNLKTSKGREIEIGELNITLYQDGIKGEKEKETRDLLSLADLVSETIKNTNQQTKGIETGWSKAEFRSALYDLKTRKFSCEKIEYSDVGRVKYIEFKEF